VFIIPAKRTFRRPQWPEMMDYFILSPLVGHQIRGCGKSSKGAEEGAASSCATLCDDVPGAFLVGSPRVGFWSHRSGASDQQSTPQRNIYVQKAFRCGTTAHPDLCFCSHEKLSRSDTLGNATIHLRASFRGRISQGKTIILVVVP
jgi:hypothetical protein